MKRGRPPREGAVALKPVLIDSAMALLDHEGAEAVTIRAVARDAGVSHGAPANHFADRRELLTAVASTIFSDYLNRVAAHPASDRARAYLSELISYALAYPGRYELLWRRDLVDWNCPQFIEPLNLAYEDFLRALGEIDGGRGEVAKDIETLATAAWSMAHGYAVLRSTGIFESRTDAVTGKLRTEAILDLLLGCTKGQQT